TVAREVLKVSRYTNRLDETSPDFLPQLPSSPEDDSLSKVFRRATLNAVEAQKTYDGARRSIEDLFLESCGIESVADSSSLNEPIFLAPKKIDLVQDVLSQSLGAVF